MTGFEPTEAQTGVGHNYLTLIDPDEIPYPETDTWSLNYAAETIRTGGQEISSITDSMESTWQGLQEHYTAPESETLFAAVEPVTTIGGGLESDLATVSTALENLAEAASEARRKLNSLRIEAQTFARGLEDREYWWLTKDEENDDWAIETNLNLKTQVNTAWSEFTTAEIDCANVISGVYGGATFSSPDDATGADNELVYGESKIIIDPGENRTSAAQATVAWTLDQATEWAGQELNPEKVQFDNSRGQAAWDTLVVGVLWGTAQGAATKTGYWHEKNGWASNNEEYLDNLKLTWTETGLDAAALTGIRNEDGWLYDPRSDDPGQNLSWEWWWGNAKNSAGEVWEGHSAWSKRESDPDYQQTYTAINTVTLLGGPFKLGAEVLGFGGGRPGDSVGTEGGTGSEPGPFGGRGPGSGGPDREIADIVEDGRTPITERFGDVLDQTPAPLPVAPNSPSVPPLSGPTDPVPPPAQTPTEQVPNQQNPPSQGSTQQDPVSAPTPPMNGPDSQGSGGENTRPRVEGDSTERPPRNRDYEQEEAGQEQRGTEDTRTNPEQRSGQPPNQDTSTPDAAPGGGDQGGGEPPERANRTDDADDGESYRSPQPGTPEYESRLRELMDDPASGPANTQHKEDAARREAQVGLEAERQGLVKGPIRRGEMDYTDPSNVKDGGDFVDATGQAWDVKGFRDTFPPSAGPMAGKPLMGRGAFKISKVEDAILRELGDGENVLLDLGALSEEKNKRSIENLIRDNPDWAERVVIIDV